MSPRSSSASIPIKTPTAAVLDSRTGGVPARITISTDPDGYAELIALADHHPGMRTWALEGSGGYGAGLARHLSNAGELVVELDRPQRPAEVVRTRFRGQSTPIMLVTAIRLRPASTATEDVEVFTSLSVLRDRPAGSGFSKPRPPSTTKRSEQSCACGVRNCSH